MRLSFNDPSKLRKPLLALGVLAALLTAAPDAAARDGAGVIVASSSPSYAVGRLVEVGENVRLEPGASVTILDESGRVSTQLRSGPYRPARAQTVRTAPSLIESISALVSSDRSVRTPGGVRTLEQEEACSAMSADVGGLERALAAECDAEALQILDRLIQQAGPPQLYATLLESRETRGRFVGVQVQANFEAFLYCRLRREDSSLLAVTPEPGALPMRVLASNRYDLMFPSQTGEHDGAVQCMAIGPDANGQSPNIGEWPQQLDPEHVDDHARVAAVMLPLHVVSH
jgi:hypothetical protein